MDSKGLPDDTQIAEDDAKETPELGINIAKSYNIDTLIPKDPMITNTSKPREETGGLVLAEYVAVKAIFKVTFSQVSEDNEDGSPKGTLLDDQTYYYTCKEFHESIATLKGDMTSSSNLADSRITRFISNSNAWYSNLNGTDSGFENPNILIYTSSVNPGESSKFIFNALQIKKFQKIDQTYAKTSAASDIDRQHMNYYRFEVYSDVGDKTVMAGRTKKYIYAKQFPVFDISFKGYAIQKDGAENNTTWRAELYNIVDNDGWEGD